MAAYTLARVKRIASSAVHVDLKSAFGAAFEQEWIVSSDNAAFYLRRSATFAQHDFPTKQNQENNKIPAFFPKLLARSTRKY